MIHENDGRVVKRIFVERVKNLESFDTREAQEYMHVCVCVWGVINPLYSGKVTIRKGLTVVEKVELLCDVLTWQGLLKADRP